MSAITERIEFPVKKQRIPTAVKIILAIILPVAILIASLFAYGTHIQNNSHIYPNITIAGVDVSGLTRAGATQALNLPAYDEQINNTNITLMFPDGSEAVITGYDVMMAHNAQEMVAAAYSIGRGSGVVQDLLSYMERYNAAETAFSIDISIDADVLKSIVTEITDAYNMSLDASVPEIHDDRIVFTKGAGHVNADSLYLFERAYSGLFESLDSGATVEIRYALSGNINFGCELMALRNEILVEPQSSELDLYALSATESVVGVDFDPVAAAVIVAALEPGETATLYFDFTYPEYTQEYMQSLLFRDLIGRRTTHAAGGTGRLTNITIANEAIHGMILLPGEEFSFNETVGPRTRDRGFQTATVLMNGQFVPGTGGGICQTSSTIFAAIRPSDLRVTERRPHGRPINYLPVGWDATVAWGHIDFRFVNNTEYPLRIDIWMEYRTVIAEIWGTIVDDFPRAADWNS
ncbi:MAG: VanW family protein [Oscillospiraceae bacterium]|nr:VanW family protein [Oscillospiraceae bacterium]